MTSLTASFVDQRTLIRIGLLLVAGNLLTLFTGWSDVAGVLILGVFLPGILAAAWLLHRAFPPRAEFIAYSLGLGLLLGRRIVELAAGNPRDGVRLRRVP